MASKLAHLRTTVLFPSLHFFPGRRCSSSAVAVVPPPHPWPEWVEFVDWLTSKGYLTEDSLSLVEESNKERLYKDMEIVKEACFSFARERYDQIESLPRGDIKVILRGGCPSTLTKVVNSGKRLRAYVGLSESYVCGSCNLREYCDRAYTILPKSESAARTLDVMRVLLFYALDHKVISGFEKPAGREVVEASARKLLSKMLRLGQEACDPPLAFMLAQIVTEKEPLLSIIDEHQELEKAVKIGNWVCCKCKFLNFKRNSVCLMCEEDTPRMGMKPEIATRKGDWYCLKCRFMNFSKNRQCLNCEVDGPNCTGFAVSTKKGDWSCPKCKFFNYATRYKCRSCGKRKSRDKRDLDNLLRYRPDLV